MTKALLMGAVLAASFSIASARAQTCGDTCNTQHAVCTQAGKDYATCMGVWRQCKTTCMTPLHGPAAAPRATPAVARR